MLIFINYTFNGESIQPAEHPKTAEEGIKDLREVLDVISDQIDNNRISFDLRALWNSLSDAVTKIEYIQQERTIEVTDEEIEAKANYWYIGITQPSKEQYEFSREQIILLLTDFAKVMRDKLKGV